MQASLPPKIWVVSLLTSIHILNLLPTSTISYKNSFEVLFCLSRAYLYLRVHGRLCYSNTMSIAAYKLMPWSTDNLYLGPSFDHCGYRCVDLLTQIVIISRHVVLMKITFLTKDFHSSLNSFDYDSFITGYIPSSF